MWAAAGLRWLIVTSGAGGPNRGGGVGGRTSSRRRYRDYIDRRREQRLADKARDGSAAPVLNEEDEKERRRRKRSRSARVLLGRFWGLTAGIRGPIYVALALNTVVAALGLVMPAGTKVAIDYIITDHPGPTGIPDWVPLVDGLRGESGRVSLLWWLCGGLMAVVLFRTLLGTVGRWLMTRNTQRMKVRMRRKVFDHAVRLPLHRVHQIKSGGVASLLREDAGGAGDLLFHLFYNPWSAVVQLVGTLVVLVWVDWRMLVGALVLIPVVWMAHQTWISRIRPLWRDIRATRQGIDAHAAETFGGMRVVRGFAREHGEATRFVRGAHFMSRQEILAWWWSRGIDVAWIVMIPAATTGVLLYGGLGVINGELTIGDVMMFTAYLMMLLGPLEMLAGAANEMQTNLAGLDRVLDLFDEPKEFEAAGAAVGAVVLERGRVRGAISVRGVSFTYPSLQGGRSLNLRSSGVATGVAEGEARAALVGVDLEIPAGHTVALVGPSGSGKTTLCNLIARFYDPSHGAVLLDGVDLRSIEVDSYRSMLGIVEQDVFLFDGSIAENIAYGGAFGGRAALEEPGMPRIVAAARAANAHGFITELDAGYETLIGERGVRLSGGQKQRLAIARAILADPKILILDEATSNLDTESERLIQGSLAELMRGRTCLVIAHRLSTIRHADKIVVIEGGRILEQGTHEELLRPGPGVAGRYADFLSLQLDGAARVAMERGGE